MTLSAANIPSYHPTRPRSSTVSSLSPPLHFRQQHLQQAKPQNKDSQHTANQTYNPTLLRVHTAYIKKSQHALHASHATFPSSIKRSQRLCIARLPSTAPNTKHVSWFNNNIISFTNPAHALVSPCPVHGAVFSRSVAPSYHSNFPHSRKLPLPWPSKYITRTENRYCLSFAQSHPHSSLLPFHACVTPKRTPNAPHFTIQHHSVSMPYIYTLPSRILYSLSGGGAQLSLSGARPACSRQRVEYYWT